MWETQPFESVGKKPKYKYIPHGPWKAMKGIGKQQCEKCGLVNLNNAFTEWSIKKGCDSYLHVSYKQMRRSG